MHSNEEKSVRHCSCHRPSTVKDVETILKQYKLAPPLQPRQKTVSRFWIPTELYETTVDTEKLLQSLKSQMIEQKDTIPMIFASNVYRMLAISNPESPFTQWFKSKQRSRPKKETPCPQD